MTNKSRGIILLFILITIGTILFLRSINFDDDLVANNGKDKVNDLPLEKWVLDESLQLMIYKMQQIDSIKYDINIMDKGRGDLMMRFWIKGEKIRAEYINNWQTNTYFIDMEDEEYYYHRFGDTNAVILNKDEIVDILDKSISKKMIIIFENNYPIVVGEEKIKDKNCIVVQYSINEEETGKMWIWEEYGIPLRMEEGLSRKEITNIEITDIADDYLKLPPDIEKVDYFTY